MTTRDEPRSTVEELRAQVGSLEDRVKKLVAGELTQYRLQAKLDLQLKTQAELLQLGQRLNSSRDENEIADLVAEALVESFGHSKAVFCVYDETEAGLSLKSLEGYYEEAEEAAARQSLSDMTDLLAVAEEGRTKIETGMSESALGMDERVTIPFRSGKGDLLGVIIFGNSRRDAAYQREVAEKDTSLWETIAGMTASAFENTRLYQQLNRERESLETARDNLRDLNERLEKIVEERTAELAEAKDQYRELYLESDRTGELYRTLLDASPDPIVVYDVKGCPTYINPAFTQIFGWQLEELQGKPIDFVPPENMPETREMIGMVMRAQAFSNRPTRRHTKDGRTIDVSISGSTFWDEMGRVGGSVIHLRDITELKRMEEDLFNVLKLESVGVLAGGIAHDFNNILSGILMNAQLAAMKMKPDTGAAKYLIGIDQATRKAVALTHQLLTFAKGGTPRLKTASIAELITEWAGFVMRGSNVKCDFSIAEDLAPVEVDEDQMSQVIHNLVINAQQAMPRGGTIRISAKNITVPDEGIGSGAPLLTPGDYARISVADDGHGIPKEHLEKIFDPYFTTKDKGSGLGLASSFSILRKHRGRLTVESEINKGTTFHIYLPASKKMVSEILPEKEAEPAGESKGKIMLMDDEELLRELGGELLASLGFEVHLAADGAKAVEIYRRALESGKPFHAVIMDLTIPGGMGGRECIERIREIDPDVKAIVSSGYSTDPIMANYEDYGFSGVAAKPYRIEELKDVLQSVLARK